MKRDVFLDTDILVAYLTNDVETPSLLRRFASQAVCFTSVLNATELIAIASNENERHHAESVLWGLKVLGFHHKYSLSFGDLHRNTEGTRSLRNSMIAGICMVSKLPLVTYQPERYSIYKGLKLISGNEAERMSSWNEIQSLLTTIS